MTDFNDYAGLAYQLTTQDKLKAVSLIIVKDSKEAHTIYKAFQLLQQDKHNHPVLIFPDYQTLPYDQLNIHPDIISSRLGILSKLLDQTPMTLIITLASALQYLPPTGYIKAHSLKLSCQTSIDRQSMLMDLQNLGYEVVSLVEKQGQMAIRGSLFDIYPMGHPRPYRVDLFDDDIEQIRSFDANTQSSTDSYDCIEVLPAHEIPTHAKAITQFKEQYLMSFGLKATEHPLYQEVIQHGTPPGVEYWLPLFFDNTSLIFDYLPQSTQIFCTQPWPELLDQHWQYYQKRFDLKHNSLHMPCLPPKHLLASLDVFQNALNRFKKADLTSYQDVATDPCISFKIDTHQTHGLKPLIDWTHQHPEHVIIALDHEARADHIAQLFEQQAIFTPRIEKWSADLPTPPHNISLMIHELDEHLYLRQCHQIILAESQLFSHYIAQKQLRTPHSPSTAQPNFDLTQISPGDLMVHVEHGVGRYEGLTTLNNQGVTQEFITLVYHNDDKLYLPIHQLNRISRYNAGPNGDAPLSNLGSDAWKKQLEKTCRKIEDVAADLLGQYAHRAKAKGYPFKIDADYHHFARSFIFEETPDQTQAIADVLADMQKPTPMDRLLCADVGFGKTEVAMRAAFVCAHNHRQVAILVPTTLLAKQHFETLTNRMHAWPFNIQLLSRFVSPKEQKNTLKDVASGQCDIVIGTHKLLQSTISFDNLGLLIIDEEHRFGVKHKETLKGLRQSADVLSMTATPIPRSLNMAFNGIQDLSLMASAPKGRMSVNTFIRPHDPELIQEAITREINRSGQVYFVHNHVKSIDALHLKLSGWMPNIKFKVAHGQMKGAELEQIMIDFYHQRFDVLICTTIIETGIDIPNVNTLIIDRADEFGLSQLHQLRGRVGRSHQLAYAYLLTEDRSHLKREAKDRLHAIESFDSLGAGFMLAHHDLEIRGAGEILGKEQTGHINKVGFALYGQLLDQTIAALNRGESIEIRQHITQADTPIELNIEARIPDDYLPDVALRLKLYQRLAKATSDDILEDIHHQMMDQFGPLPQAAEHLIELHHIKLKLHDCCIQKVCINRQGAQLIFQTPLTFDPMILIQKAQQQPDIFQLKPNQLMAKIELKTAVDRINWIKDLLNEITSSTPSTS